LANFGSGFLKFAGSCLLSLAINLFCVE
jgi:hypothetical protein